MLEDGGHNDHRLSLLALQHHLCGIDGELGLAARKGRGGDDAGPTLDQGHFQALVAEVALVHGRIVARKLELVPPLELQTDLLRRGCIRSSARLGRPNRAGKQQKHAKAQAHEVALATVPCFHYELLTRTKHLPPPT